MSSDPVEYVDEEKAKKCEEGCGVTTAGWYFWDETWAFGFGPFKTEEEAREALKKYAATL